MPDIVLSANPLKAGLRMTRAGVSSFASQVFNHKLGLSKHSADFSDHAEKMMNDIDNMLCSSGIFKGINLNDHDNEKMIETIIKDHNKPSKDVWYFYASIFYGKTLEAIENNSPVEAAWAAGNAERFRSMGVFEAEFADVVEMGNSVARFIWLYNTWTTNQDESLEAFWQKLFSEHAYIFTHLFAADITVIEESAYVGGQRVDGTGARMTDFLLAGGAGKQALIVEIKNPTTKLINKTKYRGSVYSPSSDISGAVVQVNDYLEQLRISMLTDKSLDGRVVTAFHPRRVIIAGDYRSLKTDEEKRSFEVFRQELKGVDIVTFDEFFNRIKMFVGMFGLKISSE
ncbi:Shedu immune nuclease family protein [Pacificimonas sp. ICDLI1SI03]